ncbi:hypothetical protein [Azospirillum melinis]
MVEAKSNPWFHGCTRPQAKPAEARPWFRLSATPSVTAQQTFRDRAKG